MGKARAQGGRHALVSERSDVAQFGSFTIPPISSKIKSVNISPLGITRLRPRLASAVCCSRPVAASWLAGEGKGLGFRGLHASDLRVKT